MGMMNNFRINRLLSLQLEENETVIYVGGERFRKCKYLLLNIGRDEARDYDRIESIDEAIELYSREHEGNPTLLDPETEFWGHCSNLQAWAEYGYDVKLLDSRLAVPLLKALTDAGDPAARREFKSAIARRWNERNESDKKRLIWLGYLRYLDKEELEALSFESWVEFNGKRVPVIDGKLVLKNWGVGDLSEVKGLFDLEDLKELNLRGNDLKELPKSIGDLKKLESLHLQGNQLSELPKSIGDLKNLKYLHLQGNQLSELPKSIGDLKNLKSLHLQENYLSKLPKSIGDLKNLKYVHLQGNQLTELPESISNLSSLESLNLSNNLLTELPGSIGDLSSLESLNLSNNLLTELPESISNVYLREIDISYNRLTRIPDLKHSFYSIKFEGNPLLVLPFSVKDRIEDLKLIAEKMERERYY